MSKIEERVIERIRERAIVGENKYGTTMDRNDLSLMDWLTHLQEEVMDAAVYLEKIKQEVQYQEYELTSPRYHESEVGLIPGSVAADLAEIEREKRMNVIGQNGNDGLHYETTTMYPGDIEITYNVVSPCSAHDSASEEEELKDRATAKLVSQLIERERELAKFEDSDHPDLSEDTVDRCISSKVREIDTLRYLLNKVEQ